MGEAASEGWLGFPNDGLQNDRLNGGREPRKRGVALKGLSWLFGGVATLVAVTVAAVLTVIFAATLAVAVVLTGTLIALYTLTRAKRPQPRGVILEARRVGHSWVAYGWDQRRR